jgi:cytochrome P450
VNLISVGTNQNPKYYDNPEVFNYRRWLAPKQLSEEDNDSYFFVPFSGGGRNCMG